MKKKGYTLAEALIAMGVIGVVAALMLPMYSKYRPDANKALFIRTYDSIVEAVSVLVANDEFYPHEVIIEDRPENCRETENCNYLDYSGAPFLNKQPIKLIDDTWIGKNGYVVEKLCDALEFQMHAAGSSCGNNNGSITLVNNVGLTIRKGGNSCFKIDIELPNAKDASVHSILVFANGQVILDPDGENVDTTSCYLQTRGNWKRGASCAPLTNNQKSKLSEDKGYWESWSQVVEREYDGSLVD